MHDIVIRGGTLVDGSGEAAYLGDLAISGGRIAAVGEVAASGWREIEADGLAVTPGFIDVHTHYDAQYTWDPYATSSIWHGVTTTPISRAIFRIPLSPRRRASRMAYSTDSSTFGLPKFSRSTLPWPIPH